MKYFSYFSHNMNFEFQQWKANIIKTKFQKILFTRCNNVVNIALNQISFDDKGFGMDTDKGNPFFPCISHLCKFLAELTFEDHPSAWSRDHIHKFKYFYLTFIQLIINSERIWDYSVCRIICNSFREWEFKVNLNLTWLEKEKGEEKGKRNDLNCTWIGTNNRTNVNYSIVYVSLIVRAKLCGG